MNELDKLRQMLTDAKIPFISYQERRPEYNFFRPEIFGEAGRWSRNQVIYGGEAYCRRYGHYLWDGICQYGSYGAGNGLIETYGTLGWDNRHEPKIVTARQAFKTILEHWNGLDEKTKEKWRADNG